jgi:hypothetical protein
MDAASARNLQSKAQGIANQLRVLEPGSATDERCAKLLAELADAVRAPAAAYQLAPRNCIDAGGRYGICELRPRRWPMQRHGGNGNRRARKLARATQAAGPLTRVTCGSGTRG